MAKPEQKAEAVRFRVESRLSIPEIQRRVGVSKAILSLWLRPYPLTPEERATRRSRNAPSPSFTLKDRGAESKAHRIAAALPDRSSAWKGRVAEAAILFRLVLRGYEPMRSVFEGDVVDWFVRVSDRIVRIQVRWAGRGKHGLPYIDLRRKGKSRVKYLDGVIDLFVGYDLFTDTAYVFSWTEVQHKTSVTVSPATAERWDKLGV